ncbi:MAG: hypothetical protein E6Q88_13035 [Lysobacteraceae bacterium]|nr:MAG: hypothetical protein E6Q88_13035 [Xanthomonadaceae bacterium]
MSTPKSRVTDSRPSERLRIGNCLVDIPLREISAAGGDPAPVRVTLKALGVLLSLVADAGKPVSRDQLLEQVWPGTLPTDDVITQAITQLRKAFGDDRDNPRYIETISKQGYRLVAAVEWVDVPQPVASRTAAESQMTPAGAAADGMPPSAMPKSRFSMPLYRNVIAPAVVIVFFFVLGRGILDLRPRAQEIGASALMSASAGLNAIPIQRIASLPEVENQPSLSPDGSWIAYSRAFEQGAALMLQTSSAVSPRPLTEAVPGRWDVMPAWSPEGRRIAFLRYTHGGCVVMLMPAVGGNAQEVGPCLDSHPHPVSWHPDGGSLIAARTAGGATAASDGVLHRMRLDDGHWRRIAYAGAGSGEDLFPTVSPDGRWIAFQRNTSLSDLWRVPVNGGNAERLTHLHTNLYGLAWTADSKHLVFARYHELRGRLILSSLEIASGRITDYPGPDGDNSVMFPTIARNGDVVAFEIDDDHRMMRRIRLDAGEQAEHEPLLESTGSNMLPAIAPDGTQLMFMSNRSGDLRLWWAERGKPDSLRSFEHFVPMPRYAVTWHLSSQRALAIGHGPAGKGLYEIEPRQGRATRLPVPGGHPVHAAYHPDPMLILVAGDHGEGRLGLTLYDRSREPWRALARIDDVAQVVVDRRNQRVVFSRMSGTELWAAGLDLARPQRVDQVSSRRRVRLMAGSAEGVWVMDGDKTCNWRWRLVGVAGGSAGAAPSAGRCIGRHFWVPDGVSYHAGDGVVYWSMAEKAHTDIGLLPLSVLGVSKQGHATH